MKDELPILRDEIPIQAIELLGPDGLQVLVRVIDCAQRLAAAEKWPLQEFEVHYVQDTEGWEYILLVLVFESSFKDAERYLYRFYAVLDQDMKAWSSEDREILVRLLYFDVRTWEKEGE